MLLDITTHRNVIFIFIILRITYLRPEWSCFFTECASRNEPDVRPGGAALGTLIGVCVFGWLGIIYAPKSTHNLVGIGGAIGGCIGGTVT